MAYAPDTSINTGTDAVIRTELKDGTATVGTITTTITRDTTDGSTHKLRMTTSFGFYGYDGTNTFATDKSQIMAIASGIAAHFYGGGSGVDTVYEYVSGLSA